MKYPKYVKTAEGYIGTFSYLEFGEFPVYRFEGGERVVDNWEIKNGSDHREDLNMVLDDIFNNERKENNEKI